MEQSDVPAPNPEVLPVSWLKRTCTPLAGVTVKAERDLDLWAHRIVMGQAQRRRVIAREYVGCVERDGHLLRLAGENRTTKRLCAHPLTQHTTRPSELVPF